MTVVTAEKAVFESNGWDGAIEAGFHMQSPPGMSNHQYDPIGVRAQRHSHGDGYVGAIAGGVSYGVASAVGELAADVLSSNELEVKDSAGPLAYEIGSLVGWLAGGSVATTETGPDNMPGIRVHGSGDDPQSVLVSYARLVPLVNVERNVLEGALSSG